MVDSVFYHEIETVKHRFWQNYNSYSPFLKLTVKKVVRSPVEWNSWKVKQVFTFHPHLAHFQTDERTWKPVSKLLEQKNIRYIARHKRSLTVNIFPLAIYSEPWIDVLYLVKEVRTSLFDRSCMHSLRFFAH